MNMGWWVDSLNHLFNAMIKVDELSYLLSIWLSNSNNNNGQKLVKLPFYKKAPETVISPERPKLLSC